MATKKSKKKTSKKSSFRRVRKPQNYADYYRRTKDVHGYTFKLPRAGLTKADYEHVRNLKSVQNMYASGEFTPEEIEKVIRRKAIDRNINRKLKEHPRQMSAITRVWHGTKNKPGLEEYIKTVEREEGTFIKLPNANRRTMLKGLKSTNKGFFIIEKGVTARIKGKGRKTQVIFNRDPTKELAPDTQIFVRKEIFHPFPPGVDIPEYIRELYDKFKPNAVAIGVMSAHGNTPWTAISGLDYIADAILDYETRGKQHPFTGVYFYYY